VAKAKAKPVAKAKAKPIRVTRSDCAKAACPLTFTFSQAMVKTRATSRHLSVRALASERYRAEPRHKDRRPVVLDFVPRQRGYFVWTTPETLVFHPARGAFAWGHRVRVDLSHAIPVTGTENALAQGTQTWHVRVPYFESANKVASWPVQAHHPRKVAILRATAYDDKEFIGSGPLFVLYDQPVSPSRLRHHIRLASSTRRALPLRVFRPRSIARIWPGHVNLHHVIAITARHLPPNGETVTLQMPTWKKSSQPEIQTDDLTVRTDFHVRRVGLTDASSTSPHGAGRSPLRANWTIAFSSRISSDEVRRRIQIHPKPSRISVFMDGRTAHVEASLKPGRRYTLRLPKGTTDTLGNRLKKTYVAHVVAEDLPPKLALPKEPLTLERHGAAISLSALNVKRPNVQVHTFQNAAAFIRALNAVQQKHRLTVACSDVAGTATEPTRRFGAQAPTRLNVRGTQRTLIAPKKRERSLLACVEVSALGRGSERGDDPLATRQLVQITDLGVTTKISEDAIAVWVTRLSTAKPIARAKLALYDTKGKRLVVATTDRRGLARLSAHNLTQRGGLKKRAYLVATLGKDRAVVALRKDRLAQPWQFGLQGEVPGAAPLTAALFTERGVYRPGETVHIQLLARNTAHLGLPKNQRFSLAIIGPRGDTILSRIVNIDDLGSAHVTLDLPKAAKVGAYSVNVLQGVRKIRRGFRVEEYRVPTFRVAINGAKRWRPHSRVRALISAHYLHGGDLAGRHVHYRVTRKSASFAPAAYRGFTFAWAKKRKKRLHVVAEGKGRLNGSSQLALSFSTQAVPLAGPERFEIEATIRDVDERTQTTRRAQTVHPTRFYLGLGRPPQKIVPRGAAIDVPLVAVTPQGKPRPGVATQVLLERIDQHTTTRLGGRSVQLQNAPVAHVVARCHRRTEKAPVRCRFRAPKAGRYRVRAIARDGRAKVVSAFEITVPGDRSIAWPRYDHERITLVTDKPHYAPGAVARLMIESPFRHATGLLTIERHGIREQRVFEIEGDAPALKIPIRADWAPNVFASVVLVRGRIHDQKDAAGFPTGAPTFRLGVTTLRVSAPSRHLGVDIQAPPVARPGEALTLHLALPKGLPQKTRTAATVMVVDEAVLDLTNYKTPRPLAQLLHPRPLGIRTVSSRVELPCARRARHEAIFPGGGGGYDEDEAADRGEKKAEIRLRHDFAATALFAPNVRFDDHGRAKVTLTLPDNLTTYRVMAVVYDDKG
ncbi:MAG: hypothetical protein KAI47_22455, partial [Deltaproteobacteria bacterium]|nr:hypothetical protein [Deltaproteobacteria bacterium]